MSEPIDDHAGLEPGAWRRSTRSLHNRSFRLYVAGQGVSQTGKWMQQTAELWLILQLTGRGSALGLHAALRFGPILVFGIFGGLVGDRFSRRTLIVVTQLLQTLAAGVLATLAAATTPSLLAIYGVVLAQGVINAIDAPLRRGFVREMVSDDDLSNAVSLNSSVMTVGRTAGPALGGLVIAAAGVFPCFLINTLSYLAVLLSLFRIRPSALRPMTPVVRAPGQIRAGIRYAWERQDIRRALLMVGVVGTFALNWTIILPVYATDVFGGGPSLYGILQSVLSLGSFAGAVLSARMIRIRGRTLRITSAFLAGSLALTAVAESMPVAVVGLVLIGASSTWFSIAAQSRIQLATGDETVGRVLALHYVLHAGSKPVGGIGTGWVMDVGGPRLAFGIGAVAITILVAVTSLTRRRSRPASG